MNNIREKTLELENNYSVQDLFRLVSISSGVKDSEDSLPAKELRYAIYARKSTEEAERQVRSLGDQLNECQTLAKRQGLRVVKTIKESESAKEPDIRPKFRELLNDVIRGSIDGIIAWHPDRLARNMKEAGEIIDLLDKGMLSDLKLVSFTFENNTNGKLMLGIAFALSKQYSDKLGDDVKRGIRNSIKEGRYLASTPKHGYIKDKNQLLRPDTGSGNFQLIKNAWVMRLEGKTLDVIADYLNYSEYSRSPRLGAEPQRFQMTKKDLSLMFKDPFYAGVLKYGDTIVALPDVYEFVQMISVDEFLSISNFRSLESAFRGRKDNVVKADFLRGIVYCPECNKKYSTGLTSKKLDSGTKNYFYFRCETKGCRNKGKSVRGKVIIAFVNQFLIDNKFTSRQVYSHYKQEMKVVIERRHHELIEVLHKKESSIRSLEAKIAKQKGLLLNEKDNDIKRMFSSDLKADNASLNELRIEVINIKNTLKNEDDAILKYEEFLELMTDLPSRLRKAKKLGDKDKIIRKIFSNFTANQSEVVAYKLNSPFKELLESEKVTNGRRGGT